MSEYDEDHLFHPLDAGFLLNQCTADYILGLLKTL